MAVTYQGAVDTMTAYLDAHPETDGHAYADALAELLLNAIRPSSRELHIDHPRLGRNETRRVQRHVEQPNQTAAKPDETERVRHPLCLPRRHEVQASASGRALARMWAPAVSLLDS